MRATRVVMAAGALVLCASAAAAKPFPRLWVFGDSTVDTGWYKVSPYSGERNFDIWFARAGAFGIGAPTSNPGPVSVQTLAHVLQVGALPQNQGGTNYASSGARNEMVNTPGSGFFPNAVPTMQQIAHYLQTHHPNGRALYLVSSGGNDVAYALKQAASGAMTDMQARSYIADTANHLGGTIQQLHSSGAKFIIVANLPEDFGPSTDNTKAYRALYNTTLQANLANAQVAVAWGDANAVRRMITHDMSAFNLAHVTNAAGERACTDPAASTHLTTDWALVCSPGSPASKPTATDPNQSLFADDAHWASGGQRILGSYYFCIAKTTWPQKFTGYAAHPPIACGKFGL